VITVGGFNTSLDKSMQTDRIRIGGVSRVSGVRAWPGGKGVHVALTAAALGEPVRWWAHRRGPPRFRISSASAAWVPRRRSGRGARAWPCDAAGRVTER
jgi:hypothetical protein